ncbi:MAG: alkaline phosphatase family protein [Alphaproteobacteria bacterium]|nr:alkaline phosphatase family protein [Alphaproteobacteria bacterium]
MRHRLLAALTSLALAGLFAAPSAAQTRHNVILFVPDGLRAVMVDPDTAPAMAAVRDHGVDFRNSHALFPTFTTANASAMATGHYLGDTGDFSNTIYTGYAVAPAKGTVTPFLENDPVLTDLDQHFNGDYLDEATVLAAARAAGYGTAAIGKLGPALIFDIAGGSTGNAGNSTIVVDDSTGSAGGVPLAAEVAEGLARSGLPATAPGRGDNGKPGTATEAGTYNANIEQQNYFVAVATKVVLPLLKSRNQPFMLVFWSRDPDGTQHNQGDSLGRLEPGINGPTSLAAIRNADNDLAQLRDALGALGLADITDIVVSADHGFSTISKESATSAAAQASYDDVPHGQLPLGFVALDLAQSLDLPLWDPDGRNARVAAGKHPSKGNGLLGQDPERPEIVVAANGGSDLVYLPQHDTELTGRAVTALLAQDYVSGIFVDDALGQFPGTLPLSAINLEGAAVTPRPAVVANFRSFDTGCGAPLRCTAEVADTGLQQGQGMHGSFSRADTRNFMAAIGPDFKAGFADEAPVSNADLGKTLVQLLGLQVKDNGKQIGRVLAEAMPGGALPPYSPETIASDPGPGGLRTVLNRQKVGDTLYFDAAGFAGRTVGLEASPKQGAAAKP